MQKIFGQLMSLFKSVEESSLTNPVVHELIERSEKDLMGYEQWKNSLDCQRALKNLSLQYALLQTSPDEIDPDFTFLNTPSSKGFAIHFHQHETESSHAAYLFDYLKELVLLQGYKCQISDTRTYSQKTWVETLDRHYLKPITSFAEGTNTEGTNTEGTNTEGTKINQLYGNVLIELVSRNSHPYSLKFQVNTYHDHLYRKALDFHDMMQLITE